jgi:hypothetical protein
MLFGAPDQKLGDIIEQQLKPLMQPDPDFDKIDWDAIEWTKSGEPWTPDFNKTIGYVLLNCCYTVYEYSR